MDSTTKKIIRGFFKPFEVIANCLWWVLKHWYIVFISGIAYIFCFIFPNVKPFPDIHLAPNWVLLGFRNLGFVVCGIIALAIIYFAIWGLAKLYKWSHNK